MKRHLLFSTFALFFAVAFFAQPVIVSSIVPRYTQGVSGTNNKRMPFVFWAHVSGLTPLSIYRYYTAIDSFGAPAGSNGAGNSYFVNASSGVLKRTNGNSLVSVTGYDSLSTDAIGDYAGWFMAESSGNIRFVPGKKVYPMIVTNNGLGGTATTNRIRLTLDTVWVNDFGTTSNSPTQCSAIYDSTVEVPKSFVFLYDNVAGTNRPVSGAIVEDDGLSLQAVTQISNTYKTNADSMQLHWCTIIPNALATGIELVEYRSFGAGTVLSTLTDADGVWCNLVNTVNVSSGQPGFYLNSLCSPTMGIVSASVNSAEFKLYPMPVQNNLIVENGSKNNFSVVLFDITGREMEKRSHQNGKIIMDIEKYNSGNYFLKIIDEKTGEVITKKVIKE
ncbi:MAG: T9SS type A sorting domain-containing protein [Bacteroidia bacterium]|nr:T9SS type A sorting domain-containing protein [Bacteroidia bacterium]